ncbi:AzlC family ABC transporter permease [Utexia brackfieldae]|uniref:AzlC family ABC transporter permease n=1 Tax=Utexia brackfieldae TaxID=3074108 RepID=UPI00370DAA5E
MSQQNVNQPLTPKPVVTFKDGARDCLPTILGYMGIGIAAGVLGRAANLSVLEITLMAMFIYAGASQFIIAGMMVIGSPVSAIILTTFFVNSRHFLMSMAQAAYFRRYNLWHNMGIGSLLTDESFAVAMNFISLKRPITAHWMHGLNVMAYLSWILSCLLGAILGSWLPNPQQFGLDFALVAMFIGLLYLQIISDKQKKILHTLLIMSAVVIFMVIFMRFLSPQISLLAATLLGCLIGVVTEK